MATCQLLKQKREAYHQSNHLLLLTTANCSWLSLLVQLAIKLAVWTGSSETRGMFAQLAQELWTIMGQG